MDRGINMMDIIFRNPEAKKVTFKYIIILIIGIVTMTFTSYYIINYIKDRVIEQNTIMYSYILQGENNGNIIKSLSEEPSKEEINKAVEVLKGYGYNENMSIESNEMLKDIFSRILFMLIPMICIFITVLYISFMKELKNIYEHMEEISSTTDSMSKGKFKAIDGEEKEGEMAKLISSLNYMGDRVNNSIDILKKDKENLKDFLSDISHQLKTPLASLVMFNDLMIENENMPYEDRVKFLKSSEEQLERMEWLIMNLLKVGRLEADAIKFEIYKQPLRETLECAVSPFVESSKSKNQILCVTGDLDTEVSHDKEWLSEAISNIVKNAVEHTGQGGRIEVNVSHGPLITKIFIKDNGPGIPECMQKKVFKRFYKGENSSNPTSIGIGLSLAKSIIEEQGAEIKLISEEGKGTTFIISFFE